MTGICLIGILLGGSGRNYVGNNGPEYMKECLETILARARRDGFRHYRQALRDESAIYSRSIPDLLEWMFPSGNAAIETARVNPGDATATRGLCKALYRNWRSAKAMPRHFATRRMRIANLRRLFACECALYLHQRTEPRRVDAPQRSPGAGEWLNEICRKIEMRGVSAISCSGDPQDRSTVPRSPARPRRRLRLP